MNRWFALLLAVCAAASVGYGKEPVVELEPFRVDEDPVAFWGISFSHPTQVMSWLPSRRPFTVIGVLQNSPAHLADVRVGEQITHLNGQNYRSLSMNEVRELFFHAKPGNQLKLTLSDPLAGTSREVTLALAWRDSSVRYAKAVEHVRVFWGIFVKHAASLRPACAIVPLRRKMPRERRCIVSWSGRFLTLIERPGAGVEIKEGNFSKPAKDPEPPGRLLPLGSTVELRADGSYEVMSRN